MREHEDWMDYMLKDEKGSWATNPDGSYIGLVDDAPDNLKEDFHRYNAYREREKSAAGFYTLD